MSTNFGLTTSTPPVNVIQSINYLLSTVGTINSSANVNLGNVVLVSSNNAIYSNVGIIGYVNGYMDVKYSNSSTGSSGFTSNSTLANYYGVYNSSTNSESSNPVDYQWTQVSGGFGTTKGLYYTTGGGNSISFYVGTAAPNQYYQAVPDDVPIVLASISSNLVVANSLSNSSVTTNAIASQAVTGYNIAANTITANNIQVGSLTANLFVAGTITAANSIQSSNATFNDPNSAGFWLNANTGDVRFAGNTSVGNNLTVGNSAIIGGNLTIGGLVSGGNLQSNTVSTTTIISQSISQGIGQSSGNNVTFAYPRSDNNTSSSVYYVYPYSFANIIPSNYPSQTTAYINATFSGYAVGAYPNTIYGSLLYSTNGGQTWFPKSKATFIIESSGTTYINPAFTWIDFPLPTPTVGNTISYALGFSVYGSSANASTSVTQLTFYTATAVCQVLKR